MPALLGQKLDKAKRMAVEYVEVAFEELEREVVGRVLGKQEGVAGRNWKMIESERKAVNESLKSLERMIQSISSEKCLSTVIKFMEH